MLDVKVGTGAFMKTLDDGLALARAMVDIGNHAGRRVRAVLTDMDAPLGRFAGNSLEVQEAVATLNGHGPQDLTELCVALAVEVLAAYGEEAGQAEARARQTLQGGSALARLRAFVAAQGGDPSYVDQPQKLDVAPGRAEVTAETGGYVQAVDALAVGQAVLVLGGGRERKGQAIDHGVGVELVKKPGEAVGPGEVLARIYHRDERGLSAALALLGGGLKVGPDQPQVPALILGRVE